MNKIALAFEDIYPFVRLAHIVNIEPHIRPKLLKAFDYRLFYIYGGEGSFIVNGRKYPVAKGNLLFWQPGTEYSIHCEPTHTMTIIGINFDFTWNKSMLHDPIPPEKPENFNEDDIVEYALFTDAAELNEPAYLKDLQQHESFLLEINYEYTVKKKYYLQRISGLFLSLMDIVARYLCAPGAAPNQGYQNVDLMLDYIHSHYDQPVSNGEIGAKFNFHPNYINKLMVMHTGTSLHQYLINYRIARAVNLMQTSDKSISEIAYAVGYKDISYFSRVFKSKMGESPGSFKDRFIGRI